MLVAAAVAGAAVVAAVVAKKVSFFQPNVAVIDMSYSVYVAKFLCVL